MQDAEKQKKIMLGDVFRLPVCSEIVDCSAIIHTACIETGISFAERAGDSFAGDAVEIRLRSSGNRGAAGSARKSNEKVTYVIVTSFGLC